MMLFRNTVAEKQHAGAPIPARAVAAAGRYAQAMNHGVIDAHAHAFSDKVAGGTNTEHTGSNGGHTELEIPASSLGTSSACSAGAERAWA